MLSKEQILEIIAYCDHHGVQRKERLQEPGTTEWNFYKTAPSISPSGEDKRGEVRLVHPAGSRRQ